jgi:hypothetical protein
MTLGWFQQLAKYGMPAFFLIMPLVALYGKLSPWPPAREALAQYSGQTPVMVGVHYRARHSITGNTTEVSRSYVLFPMAFSNPKLITVLQVNDRLPMVSESGSDFFLLVGMSIVCLIGTWWFWFRVKKEDAT